MLAPAWVLVLAMLCGRGQGVASQCWEHLRCRDLRSEESVLECIDRLEQCGSDLTEESPVYPGISHLQPLSGPEDSDDSYVLATVSPLDEEMPSMPKGQGPTHEDKRSYSMEHFRWGKPVGRKRRPIKVLSGGPDEDSNDTYPTEVRREMDRPAGDSNPAVNHSRTGLQEKEGKHKIGHFRWETPSANKRYGGFMKSSDERSQKPLLTLFKNVIIKDGHQKKTSSELQ